MKTLADEILDALPALMTRYPDGAGADDIGACLSVSVSFALAAMRELHADRRAFLVRYPGSKRRLLTPIDHDFGYRTGPCAHCGVVYRKRREAQRYCSQSCAGFGAWATPDIAERRCNGMNRAMTPERVAALTERARSPAGRATSAATLRAANARAWGDPALKAIKSAALQRANGDPARRSAKSAAMKAKWADPEWSAKVRSAMTGVKKSTRPPVSEETRAKLSAGTKARWENPETREKYLAGVRGSVDKRFAKRRAKTVETVDA